MERNVSGISVLIVGIIFFFLGIFISGAFYIYAGILIVLSIFILFNKNEDKIEQIKFNGGKKWKR